MKGYFQSLVGLSHSDHVNSKQIPAVTVDFAKCISSSIIKNSVKYSNLECSNRNNNKQHTGNQIHSKNNNNIMKLFSVMLLGY
jgi:hypothetical protein